MNTTYAKSHDGGHIYTTTLPLGHDRRELRIQTRKTYRGGVETSAMVVQVHEDGRGFVHTFGLAGGGDFSAKVFYAPNLRATEKAVRLQHEAQDHKFKDLFAQAMKHYGYEVNHEPA